MGSKGDSYDNALAETINGLYKAELIHRRAPWKTKEAVELATLEWVTQFDRFIETAKAREADESGLRLIELWMPSHQHNTPAHKSRLGT